MSELVRYRSPDEDSARWLGFPFRDGDIVISARSKSGTNWMQMIFGLLVFQTPTLPDSLGSLSPWLDWIVSPRQEVFARLEEQTHRRFIKTHTPLDGVPLDPRATYIVVARHPLDTAVSLYHHSHNIDRARVHQLTGQPMSELDRSPRSPLREWLLAWIEWTGSPREELDSLPGITWHLGDAWSRRAQPNVVLFHYDDLLADLGGEMHRLAGILGVGVAPERWPELVRAAGFDGMRANADELIDPFDVLKDKTGFFRRGASGSGRDVLSDDEVMRYHDRAATLAPADLLRWLHRDAG